MTQPTTANESHDDLDPHLPHRPADDREEVYFEGSPLLRGELVKVAFFSLIGLAMIAAPIIYWSINDYWWHWAITVTLVLAGLLCILIPYLNIKRIRYRITNYRIDFERGLFSKQIDTLELWHVDDIKFAQSFFDRLFGVGTLTILSNDKTTPRLDVRGLPKPRPIFDALKQRIIAVKRQRGVIKMDVG
jgi:membrane protein YdbS with pleckstrin-like domain